ncbi:hypothetical protein BT93_B2235 [Corymbia citriodora subsp. variegata]|nr:hypothetical protein BT93_B2235 [Corymbia citriodora subsp. variegata]
MSPYVRQTWSGGPLRGKKYIATISLQYVCSSSLYIPLMEETRRVRTPREILTWVSRSAFMSIQKKKKRLIITRIYLFFYIILFILFDRMVPTICLIRILIS